jgi:hypothetical protein
MFSFNDSHTYDYEQILLDEFIWPIAGNNSLILYVYNSIPSQKPDTYSVTFRRRIRFLTIVTVVRNSETPKKKKEKKKNG